MQKKQIFKKKIYARYTNEHFFKFTMSQEHVQAIKAWFAMCFPCGVLIACPQHWTIVVKISIVTC